jgi:hypothetical protein
MNAEKKTTANPSASIDTAIGPHSLSSETQHAALSRDSQTPPHHAHPQCFEHAPAVVSPEQLRSMPSGADSQATAAEAMQPNASAVEMAKAANTNFRRVCILFTSFSLVVSFYCCWCWSWTSSSLVFASVAFCGARIEATL